jgi:hypothetical protein
MTWARPNRLARMVGERLILLHHIMGNVRMRTPRSQRATPDFPAGALVLLCHIRSGRFRWAWSIHFI